MDGKTSGCGSRRFRSSREEPLFAGESRYAKAGATNVGVNGYKVTDADLSADKRRAIPSHLAPILERIGVNSEAWCDLVQVFTKHFRLAAGSRGLVAAEATRRNQTNLQAPGAAILNWSSLEEEHRLLSNAPLPRSRFKSQTTFLMDIG